ASSVGAQLRFADGDATAWARRADRLRDGPGLRIGAAIHSVRAVDEAGLRTVAAWAAERGAPLHLHLSEQPAENAACLEATGLTPTQLLDRCQVLTAATTAVHAIHLNPEDIRLLGQSRVHICACPTTERDLGDGVCPADQLLAAGCGLCLGSDSQAVVDIFEEARAVELDLRLLHQRRGLLSPERLLQAATVEGMEALGWDAGRLAPGWLADFVTLELSSPRLAGAPEQEAVSAVVFAATAADVRSVVVGGHLVVAEGQHQRLGDLGEELARVLAALEAGGG
ncbi:MAG: amidohydrolase family protein, partial [Candidatus Dormibacteria bacterium]